MEPVIVFILELDDMIAVLVKNKVTTTEDLPKLLLGKYAAYHKLYF
jgi:hypothetical protein|tara:strand:+ start:1542 stop:1679 length:138 start_codon:yes stop_codon:yes gene_type:complete